MRSFYFIFITCATIGYGDISPINDIEIIYVIVICFLSTGIFATFINSIGQIYQEME